MVREETGAGAAGAVNEHTLCPRATEISKGEILGGEPKAQGKVGASLFRRQVHGAADAAQM